MKRFGYSIAIAAVVLGTAIFPTQPAESKTLLEMADSAFNAVRRQNNPYNAYGVPTYYQPTQNRSFLGRVGDRFLGTGTQNQQYIYNPYTGQYQLGGQFQQSGTTGGSLSSQIRSGIFRSVINRLF